jgi:predicted PurR-regulated permease PerM
MAVAALILGIASLAFCWSGFIGSIIGVVGIILGAIAIKKLNETKKPNGMAKAGLVMSIIGVVLGLIIWISCMFCYKAAGTLTNELSKDPKLQESLKKATKELEKAAKEAEKAEKAK